MPIHQVGNKWQWGQHGKLYPTRGQAEAQAQAAHAAGFRERRKTRVEPIQSVIK